MYRLFYFKKFLILLSVLFLVSILAPFSYGYEKSVALVIKSFGDAKLSRANNGGWRQLRVGTRLNSGDQIKTGDDALVALMFTDDKSLMKIRSYSNVTIKTKKEKQTISKRIFASFGNLWFKVTSGSRNFRLASTSGIAAVKGTEFYAIITKNGEIKIIGIKGIVKLYNKLGSVLVKAGQTGILKGENSKPGVGKSDPKEIPSWAGQTTNLDELQLEFEDNDGNKKTLKIIFQKK